MTTSPSSGLSAEAKEFVPLLQPSPTSIPLYVDENTVASIYPSDQTPVMIQTIYPMMISNTKMTDLSSPTLLPFPEIEFHIQPSQQQQFQIDSSSNTSASTGGTSQIVLLPTNNGNAATSLTAGYYPVPPFLYSPTDPNSAFYPMEFAEQPLINFSMPPSTMMNKSNRISSQQQQQQQGSLARPTSFRQSHGNPSSSYRTNHRVGGITGNSSTNRNSYYDYHSRRNGSTYPPTSYSGRGSNSNSKRISSSYHQQDYHHYYHHPSSRSRGYAQSRSSQYHDEQRKDANDYYNAEKESYPNDSNTSNELNEDGTPFEFRPEDFPSLPINQPNEKMPTPTVPTAKFVSLTFLSSIGSFDFSLSRRLDRHHRGIRLFRLHVLIRHLLIQCLHRHLNLMINDLIEVVHSTPNCPHPLRFRIRPVRKKAHVPTSFQAVNQNLQYVLPKL